MGRSGVVKESLVTRRLSKQTHFNFDDLPSSVISTAFPHIYIVSHTQSIHIASVPPADQPNMPTPRALATPAIPMTPSMQMMGSIPGPPGPPGQPGAPGDSSKSLEQRIYDLLVPVREMGQEYEGNHGTPSREDESKALILCGTFDSACSSSD
jgi:hypothetical protein